MKFENLNLTSTTDAAPNFDGMYHNQRGRKPTPKIVKLERFHRLVDEKADAGIPREAIAKEIGCDTSTVTKQYNDKQGIDIEYLYKYSKYFNVSADYLLGLSDVSSTDHVNIVDAPTDSLGNPVSQNTPTGILNMVDFNNQKLKELFETISAIESKITPESAVCDGCSEHVPVNSLLGAVSFQEIIIKDILTIANHIYEML